MYLSRGAAERIVEHIAAHLDLRIWVLDRSSGLLASSEDGDGRPPAGLGLPPMLDGASGALNGDCRSFPLHYAEELVGTLVVAGPAGHSDEVAHVAKVMAELIIRQMADVEQLIDRQWALNRFVYELLLARFADRPAGSILQEAKLLNVNLAVPRTVALIQITPLLDHLQHKTPYPTPAAGGYRRQRHQLRRHLLRQAQEIIRLGEQSTFSYMDEQQLVILAAAHTAEANDPNDPAAPFDGDKARRQVQGEIQRFVDEMRRTTNVNLAAGVGDFCRHWQSLPSSYRDAQLAAKAGQVMYGAGHACTLADLGLAAFLCGDHASTGSRLADQLLRPLVDNPELLETLDVFLGANLSPSLAAQKLHIHRHTLTYRLENITRLTGLNPREFGSAAQLYAALLSHKLVAIDAGSEPATHDAGDHTP
ncbi:MAG: helix-turn-helix domain-containing protein [Caldilineaceae bacterium]